MDAHDFKVKGGIFGLGGGHVLSRDEEWGDAKRNGRYHTLCHP